MVPCSILMISMPGYMLLLVSLACCTMSVAYGSENFFHGQCRESKSSQSSSRQHASRPEAMPLDFMVRPQSKIDPDEIRARAKQVVHDQRRLKVHFLHLIELILVLRIRIAKCLYLAG